VQAEAQAKEEKKTEKAEQEKVVEEHLANKAETREAEHAQKAEMKAEAQLENDQSAVKIVEKVEMAPVPVPEEHHEPAAVVEAAVPTQKIERTFTTPSGQPVTVLETKPVEAPQPAIDPPAPAPVVEKHITYVEPLPRPPTPTKPTPAREEPTVLVVEEKPKPAIVEQPKVVAVVEPVEPEPKIVVHKEKNTVEETKPDDTIVETTEEVTTTTVTTKKVHRPKHKKPHTGTSPKATSPESATPEEEEVEDDDQSEPEQELVFVIPDIAPDQSKSLPPVPVAVAEPPQSVKVVVEQPLPATSPEPVPLPPAPAPVVTVEPVPLPPAPIPIASAELVPLPPAPITIASAEPVPLPLAPAQTASADFAPILATPTPDPVVHHLDVLGSHLGLFPEYFASRQTRLSMVERLPSTSGADWMVRDEDGRGMFSVDTTVVSASARRRLHDMHGCTVLSLRQRRICLLQPR
jgi:hypothetical protein